MDFRRQHPQHVAAAKAGFSERTGRRVETAHHRPPMQAGQLRLRRQTADPFLGLWDGEIRPMLEATPGLRPVTLLDILTMTGIACVAPWSGGSAPGPPSMGQTGR
jgi:hypothetical protein